VRDTLSDLITLAAKTNPKVIVLSGDHGYALFDQIRKERPDQFINCGVAEQAMVGIAAGLVRSGFRPIVYGLSAFIPCRVLEQIKLDICFSNLPVIFLGDGAGLVYSTLGASHQCAEDIAVLQPLPNISIYSPSDKHELDDCFEEALSNGGPSYIRIGKSDRPAMTGEKWGDTEFRSTANFPKSRTCLVATGSMVSPATLAANKYNLDCYSVPRIKPFPYALVINLVRYDRVITLEEHSIHGGLYASLLQNLQPNRKDITPIALKDQFADKCGSYQYALSEHGMDDASIDRRIREIVNG
jgi:transketolase